MNWRELKASEVTERDETFFISEEEHKEMKEYEEWCKTNDLDYFKQKIYEISGVPKSCLGKSTSCLISRRRNEYETI